MASFLALVGAAALPAQPTIAAGGYSKPAYSRTVELFAGVWEKSDALWYIHLAQDGYGAHSGDAAFFPLYPAAVRAVHWLCRLPWIVCALLVSNIACFGALLFLHQLVELDFGTDVARRTLWYQLLFPGSLFLLAPYTESLFLLLAVLSLYGARSGRWWLAGASGMFLGLTRNIGVLIAIPLLLEVHRQRRGLVRVFLVPLGLIAWMGFWYFKTGDPLAFIRAQSGWERESSWPWSTLLGGISQAWQFAATYPGGVYILEASGAVLAIGLAAYSFIWMPASYTAFAWLALLPPLFAPYPGRMLMSYLRFAAVAFPIFVLLARSVKRESDDLAIRVAFAGVYGLCVALFVANQNFF